MMGLFAAFCGLMYNDFMAIPLNIFQTCFPVREVESLHSTEGYKLVVDVTPDCVYPVGLDPGWYLGTNMLSFLNSLKMKLSVILGVAQMCLGIFMKAFNATYFKCKIDFIFEFVP